MQLWHYAKCTYTCCPVEGVGGKLTEPDLYKAFDWAVTSLLTTMPSFFTYFHSITTRLHADELLFLKSLRNEARMYDTHRQDSEPIVLWISLFVFMHILHIDEQPPHYHNNSITADTFGPKSDLPLQTHETHTLLTPWYVRICAVMQKTQTHMRTDTQMMCNQLKLWGVCGVQLSIHLIRRATGKHNAWKL